MATELVESEYEELAEAEAGEQPVTPPQETIEQVKSEWMGRVRQRDTKLERVAASLAAQGLTLDAEGNIVPTAGYQQPQQPAPVSEQADWVDYDNLSQSIDERIEKRVAVIAAQQVGQGLGAIAPILNKSYNATLRQEYPDWDDIGKDVQDTVFRLGFTNIAQASAIPNVMETAIDAVRGKRLAARAADPAAEGVRQARLAQAAQVGGENAPLVPGRIEYTPQ